MALTDKQRAALLAYCRLDDPEPEQLALLENLCQAAQAYLDQAGIRQPPEDSPPPGAIRAVPLGADPGCL